MSWKLGEGWSGRSSVAALCLVLAACGPGEVDLTRANVVVVLADTLRADHLGAYGHERPTSPFLDELAQEAVLFERVWSSASQTAPSVLSLFTGLYPHRHGIQYHPRTQGFHPRRVIAEPEVSADLVLLAEILARSGFHTGAVVTNPWLAPRFGFGRGFEVYEHLPSERRHEAHASGARVNEIAREILEHWNGERFFLYLHYMDVHGPYEPSPRARREFADELPGRAVHQNGPAEPSAENLTLTRALYEAEVRDLDDRIRELFDTLGALGLRESTLVVFTSDHGEAFLEHGGLGHGWGLHEELVHAPLWFSHPTLRTVARRVRVLASGVDLLPTLLDLVGEPPATGIDGISLAPLVRGETADATLARRIVLSELGNAKAARRGDRKLVRRLWPEQATEAFDLAIDPAERAPQAAPAWAGELDRALAAIPPDPRIEEDAPLPEPDTMERRVLHLQLKQLGYIE